MARKLIVEVVGDSSSFERSLGRATRATNTFSRDFSKAERGVLAGSGVFKSLGRTLAFASGGFLAFGGASAFIRKTIDAAKDAQVTQAQLAAQLRANGQAFSDYRDEIDKTTLRLSALSGFDDDELKAALVTITRTVPNVTKALRDTATAADLARARHISLANAATLVAKVEAGNTTLLRRQGIQVSKNATVEEALAALRAKVAGQARAGATEQERFGAALQNSEEIVGGALLPTLNRYLSSGEKWLQQMNQSGALQRQVAGAAHQFESAVSDAAHAIKVADSITGSFKNTLELLLGLKLASVATGWASQIGLFASKERDAARTAELLRAQLARLAAIGVITIGIEILINRKTIDNTVSNFLDDHGLGFLGSGRKDASGLTLANIDQAIDTARKFNNDITLKALEKYKAFLVEQDRKTVEQFANITGGAAQHAALEANAISKSAADTAAKHGVKLTVEQRNQFFDNAIARILLRGGLGDIQQQIAALEKANQLISQRIAKTKDVTRRLNLEDQLLQNQAQIASLQATAATTAAQAASDALQKRQDAFNEFIANLQLKVTEAQATEPLNDDIVALKALQAGIEAEIREFGRTADLSGQLFDVQQQLAAARASQISGRQFLALGLTQTGEQRIPGVTALKKELGNVTEEVQGTFLDTTKVQSLLSRIRKVLSGGLGAVGEDVRAKIQQILGDLNRQLDQNTAKNLTKWRHLSTQAFLAGIPDLTPQQRRILSDKLAVISPAGTVPSKATKAFALAGVAATVTAGDVYMDGEKVGRITHSATIKRGKKRTIPRAG